MVPVPLLHIVVLALVQGITEFLPISSSAHLILVPEVFAWPDQGLLLDVAVHVGTLGAVLVYFWRDVRTMVAGTFELIQGRSTAGAKLAMLVLVATAPVVVVGSLLTEDLLARVRDIKVIGWTTLIFGLALYASDVVCARTRRLEDMRIHDAVLIGLAQVLALVPGTSRSGITMTLARTLGMDRPDAARFSLLLAMPTLFAAGVLAGLDLQRQADAALTSAALTAAALAFVSALAAIAVMMAWLRRASFTPFVVYRVILGALLLAFGYGVFD